MRTRSVLVLLALLVLSCRSHAPAPVTSGESEGPPSVDPEPIHFVEDPELDGLRVRLSDADAPPDGPGHSKLAESYPVVSQNSIVVSVHHSAKSGELSADGRGERMSGCLSSRSRSSFSS